MLKKELRKYCIPTGEIENDKVSFVFILEK